MATNVLPQRQKRNRKNQKKVVKVEEKAVAEGVPKSVEEARVIQSKFDSSQNQAIQLSTRAQRRKLKKMRGSTTQVASPVSQTPAWRPDVGQITQSFNKLPSKRKGIKGDYFTKYLTSLVDPERFGDNLRIPDSYTGKTTAWKQLINFNLPLLIAGASAVSTGNIYNYAGRSNFPTGSFHIFAIPSFTCPLTYLAEFNSAAGDAWDIEVTEQNEFTGFRARSNETDDSVSDQGDTLVLTKVFQNIVGPMVVNRDDPSSLIWPFRNLDNNGLVFYGYSVNNTNGGGGGTCIVNVETMYAGGAVVNGIVCAMVNANGTVGAQVFANLAPGVISFNMGAATNVDGRGDAMIGFMISLVDVAGVPNNLICDTIQVHFNLDTQPQLQWKSIQFPNYVLAAQLFDSYRVGAMSLLTSFTGSALQNGGQIASRLNYGEPFLWDSSGELQLWNYGGLSSAKRSYNGRVSEGTYTWWHPIDKTDMVFEQKGQFGSKLLSSAHIFHTGTVIPVANGTGGVTVPVVGTIRARFNICYEAISNKSFVPSMNGPVNKGLLTQVKVLVDNQEIPTSTANETHEEILKWLNMPVEWIESAAPKLLGAAGTIAPLLSMFGFL